LWEVLEIGLAMAEETNGLFDPTLLNALEQAGYVYSFDKPGTGHKTTPRVQGSRTHGGRFRQIRRRAGAQEVWLPAGVRIDLGGIAKGYTAHLAVEHLRKWGPALVDAGGDLVAGDAPPGWPGWPVAVAAPASAGEDETADLAMLWLMNATLATSGVDYRRWQWSGRNAHHIIDPRRGEPAITDLLSVTILDSSAARAEAWATAAIVLGSSKGAAILAGKQLAGLLVRQDRSINTTPALRRIIARQERMTRQLGQERLTDDNQ
jgi:thiamine biosynthesis lipoprotein